MLQFYQLSITSLTQINVYKTIINTQFYIIQFEIKLIKYNH